LLFEWNGCFAILQAEPLKGLDEALACFRTNPDQSANQIEEIEGLGF